jgi:ribonuclease D
MTESKFKTMRHIETVRNHLDTCIMALMYKAQHHDQSKLQSPEVEIFEEYTPKLRDCVYDSEEYRQNMKEMKVAIDHHNENNDHHPEHFKDSIRGMNLLDLVEMICDWRSASMRHATGDIYKSIEINQKRFGYSDDLKQVFINTAHMISAQGVYHRAEES